MMAVTGATMSATQPMTLATVSSASPWNGLRWLAEHQYDNNNSE
jgi:hypothetical protein